MKQRFFLTSFLMVTIPVVLAVTLIGGMSVFLSVMESGKTIRQTNAQTIGRVRESLELMFSEADAQSLNYSVSPYVLLKLEELLKSGYAEKENLDVSYMIKTFVDSNVNSKPYLHSVYIYLENKNDNFFASTIGLANRMNFRDVSWLDDARKMPREQRQWISAREIGAYGLSVYSTRVLSLYKRLYSSDAKIPIGVLVMNISIEYLEELLDKNLTYLKQTIRVEDSSSHLLVGSAIGGTILEDGNAFVHTESEEAYGLTISSIIPRSELFSQSRGMVALVLAGVAVSLMCGGVIAFLIARRTTRNIQSIISLLDAAERNEPLPEVHTTGNEYSYIVQNIVKTFLEKTYLNTQLTEKKYRLDAVYFAFLQAQLNPHFLFNTLKNIFWKSVALTSKPNDVSRMIDLLSRVLHYALVNPYRYVPLEDELENTRRYIEIQQMRFDASFSVSWEIDSGLEDAKCIKFLFQPMVENSITHGLRGETAGTLVISVSRVNDGIRMEVSDDGRGFTPARLDEILSHLGDKDAPIESIGLYNLNMRLVLAYGDGAGIGITSIPDVRTTVSFVIPSGSGVWEDGSPVLPDKE
ncbi:MAG: histidine kinase [Sphaerochaeta sp.]